MTPEQAQKIAAELAAYCEKIGVWYTVQKDHKPKLKDITITISVRVTKND